MTTITTTTETIEEKTSDAEQTRYEETLRQEEHARDKEEVLKWREANRLLETERSQREKLTNEFYLVLVMWLALALLVTAVVYQRSVILGLHQQALDDRLTYDRQLALVHQTHVLATESWYSTQQYFRQLGELVNATRT